MRCTSGSIWIVVVLAALSPTGSAAQEPEPATDSRFADQRYEHEIRLAERLGSLLLTQHELVRQAESAAALVVDGTKRELVLRPVVVVREGRWLVRFVGRPGEQVRSLFDVSFSIDGAPRVVDHQRPRPLDLEEGQRFQAVTVAMRSMSFRCGEDYESIVMPSPEGAVE